MKERLHHLSVLEDAQAQTSPEYQRWSDTRLDRWLIDWTLRTGRERTAKKITAEKDIHVYHPQLIVGELTDITL
jgi:macrophage erythroblast attacher